MDTIPIKTEPPVCMHLTEDQYDQIVDGTANVIELCGLEKINCHTQVRILY